MTAKHHAKLLTVTVALSAITSYLGVNPGLILLLFALLFIPIYVGHRASQLPVIPSFPKNFGFVVIALFYNVLLVLIPLTISYFYSDNIAEPDGDSALRSTLLIGIICLATSFLALFPPSVEKRNRAYPTRD